MKNKSWKHQSSSPTKGPTSFSTASAGITGIIRYDIHVNDSHLVRRQEERHEKTSQSLSEAFADLSALMENAKDMVALAQRLKANHSNKEESEVRLQPVQVLTLQVNDFMLNMGLDSLVSKATSTGNLFHVELSRQLSDFLREPLTKVFYEMMKN